MKLNRIAFAFLLIASLVAGATAQVTVRQHNHRAVMSSGNPQALTALQKDLIAAIQSMTSALPIYDGNRVRAIHAAHRALVLVDTAISGTKAATRSKPMVKDNVGSKVAHSKYTPTQISQSQGNMQNGLNALAAAQKDLQSAVGSTPNKAGNRVATILNTAVSEANKAISLHQAA